MDTVYAGEFLRREKKARIQEKIDGGRGWEGRGG